MGRASREKRERRKAQAAPLWRCKMDDEDLLDPASWDALMELLRRLPRDETPADDSEPLV